MLIFRWVVLFLLLASAGLFIAYAFTGKQKFRQLGLTVLKATLGVAFLFFAVLMIQRF